MEDFFGILLIVAYSFVIGLALGAGISSKATRISDKEIQHCSNVCRYGATYIYVDGDCVCATGENK